jgi:hypothetical protein
MISFELYEIFLDKEFYNVYKDNQMIRPELVKVIIERKTKQIRTICYEEINEELLSEVWSALIEYKDFLEINNYEVGSLGNESLYYQYTYKKDHI